MRWFIRNCFLLIVCRVIKCYREQSKRHLFKAPTSQIKPCREGQIPSCVLLFSSIGHIFNIYRASARKHLPFVTKHCILPANNSGQIEFWIMTVSIKYSCAHWRIFWSHAAHYCQSKEPYWWALSHVLKSPPLTPYIGKACLDYRYDMRQLT